MEDHNATPQRTCKHRVLSADELRSYRAPMREALVAWPERLQDIVEGSATDSNVINAYSAETSK